MLEIMTISGSSADSVREIYPDTAEEYKNMVSRGDGWKSVLRCEHKRGWKPDLPVFHEVYESLATEFITLQNQVLMMRQKQTYSCNRNRDVNR